MRNEPEIRPMTEDDWERIHEMELSIFPDDLMEEEHFRRRVRGEGCFSLIQDSQVVGILMMSRFGEDEGHIGRIGVARSYQRHGLGSSLMRHAMEWFKEQSIHTIHLYTQDFNKPAQTLYKKFGFEVSGTTWHYFVPRASLNPTGDYTCQEIQEQEIVGVATRFPSMPAAQIRRYIERETALVLTLKDQDGRILGACRFTPSFSGCFPFEIRQLEAFDDFLAGLDTYGQSDSVNRRVTFTDNHALAKLCEERGYKLHHRLYKMTCVL